MSKWNQYDLENKIRQILSQQHYSVYLSENQVNRPFLSVYQLAIKLAQQFPQDIQALGYSVGGRENGDRYALTQYLARQLAGRIYANQITDIELAFLNTDHVQDISFECPGLPVQVASADYQHTILLFRLTSGDSSLNSVTEEEIANEIAEVRTQACALS